MRLGAGRRVRLKEVLVKMEKIITQGICDLDASCMLLEVSRFLFVLCFFYSVPSWPLIINLLTFFFYP